MKNIIKFSRKLFDHENDFNSYWVNTKDIVISDSYLKYILKKIRWIHKLLYRQKHYIIIDKNFNLIGGLKEYKISYTYGAEKVLVQFVD